MKTKILLIYTGGTIGMVKAAHSTSLQVLDFQNLLKNIPELHLLNCTIDAISFETPLDSSNMNPTRWVTLAKIIEKNYDAYHGFVVLHGSDTMSYSASALSFMLENLNKPVIFTGSQLPIGDLRTDAKENLITSIQLASLRQNNTAVIKEVGLYFEYKLYRGNRTTKINADHFEAFTSSNFPPLVTSGVQLQIQHELLQKKFTQNQLKVHKTLDTNVAIVKLFPGIQPVILKSIFETPNLRGVVLETYGSGNATTEVWFLEALETAISKGIYIVNVTQCIGGMVHMGHYETSKEMCQIGVISAKDMTTEAAITKLMYLLGKGISKSTFQVVFETSIRGELTEN